MIRVRFNAKARARFRIGLGLGYGFVMPICFLFFTCVSPQSGGLDDWLAHRRDQTDEGEGERLDFGWELGLGLGLGLELAGVRVRVRVRVSFRVSFRVRVTVTVWIRLGLDAHKKCSSWVIRFVLWCERSRNWLNRNWKRWKHRQERNLQSAWTQPLHDLCLDCIPLRLRCNIYYILVYI